MALILIAIITLAEAGKQLREKICEEDASVVFYYSPYLRTKQTLDEILPFFDEKEIVSCLEEPRISEQQIGNFQNVQQVLGEREIGSHHALCRTDKTHLMFLTVDLHTVFMSIQTPYSSTCADAKAERSKFGRFFYRFPSGEAGLDVYNRRYPLSI